MADFFFAVGDLDLSEHVRVQPGDGLEPYEPGLLEPQMSESPAIDGGRILGMNAGLEERHFPLIMNDGSAPQLRALEQAINRELDRPHISVQWRPPGGSQITYFDLEAGRFEPQYNYFRDRKGWTGGQLTLWTQPYGHTGTERLVATSSGIGAIQTVAVPTPLSGDREGALELRVSMGSMVGEVGQVVAVAALPHPSYAPFIPAASLPNRVAEATLMGASGAQGSQVIAAVPSRALGAARASYLRLFDVPLSPASVYAGRNRILALTRSVLYSGHALRLFDIEGDAVGPTAVASFTPAGFGLIDLGVVAVPDLIDRATYTMRLTGGALDPTSLLLPRVAGVGTHVNSLYVNGIVVLPEHSTRMVDDTSAELVIYDTFNHPGATNPVGQFAHTGQRWWGTANGMTVATTNGGEIYGASQLYAEYGVSMVDTFPPDFRVRLSVSIPKPNTGGTVSIYFERGAFGGRAQVICGTPGRSLSVQALVSEMGSVALPTLSSTEFLLELGAQGPVGWAALRGFSAPSQADLIASVAASSSSFANAWQGCDIVMQATGGPSSVAARDITVERIASHAVSPRMIYLFDGVKDRTHRLDASGVYTGNLEQSARGMLPGLAAPTPGRLAVVTSGRDGSPANDLLSVEVRVRERFRFAR